MENSFLKVLQGYDDFRAKYASGDQSIMRYLSNHGQQPKIMVVACCDSRVDPALILQCDPGDLFVVRNVANLVPPYEKDEMHHGTSAALEFGVRFLNIEHLILLGHSQCGGVQARLEHQAQNDFISNWVSLINANTALVNDIDTCAKLSLNQSYQNCLGFPWVREKIEQKSLIIHLWFFDIKTGQIFTYCPAKKEYQPLDSKDLLDGLAIV